MKAVIVPYDQLSSEALQKLIEEFVTRDGTDYGEKEVPLDTRVEQVRVQLQAGRAVIVYDFETETTTILPSDTPAVKHLKSL
jgi:uncharacterized protein YheU (UPF0270 family)